MDNLRQLLRDVLVIASHRYNGDLEISKEDRVWSVKFTEKIKNETGFQIVKAGEGPTLEVALRTTCEVELNKAKLELNRGHEFIRSMGLNPGKERER